MLLKIFSPIQKRLRKFLKNQEITTDSVLFRLHCVFTVTILVGASVILTSVQVIGKPIACIGGNPEAKELNKAIETFCWVNSTYLMPTDETQFPQNDGLQAYHGMTQTHKPRRYYAYYQWVCFVLFLQGLLCYSPKVLWQRVENGLLSKLMSGMQGILCRKDVVEKRIDVIIWYIQRYRRQHKLYPFAYWFCEGLCLINLVLQMLLMDRFLGGNFFSLSLNYLKISDVPDYKRTDPLIYVFPRVTKCDFYKVGYSGTITNVDYLCILPHNVINEKIYIFLLLWYVLMSAMFVCLMIYRIALILFPSIRPWLIVARTTRSVSYEDGAGVSSNLDLGDWWLFYMLAKNMDPLAFRDLLSEFMSREKKNTLLSG